MVVLRCGNSCVVTVLQDLVASFLDSGARSRDLLNLNVTGDINILISHVVSLS